MDNGNGGFDMFDIYNQSIDGDGSGISQQQYGQQVPQQQQQGVRYNPAQAQSTQMIRRNANQQMIQQQQAQGFLPWQDIGDGTNAQALGAVGGVPGVAWDNSDDDEDLETKALLAKKEAQNKRKQIPPFVQKLSSFLDESRNTELIRWSDDGNNFIVVDEDEFAKTLIPELFKHNNYASFVRQLNMYGFHKKVGLTDNSMRASEQKKKLPSVYYNKYFKRGRPELLWLIQKPKTATSSQKRKRPDDKKGEVDSDDESGVQGLDVQAVGEGGTTNKQLIMHNTSEINTIRNEVQMMQRQQKYILNVIQQLKRQNDQFYQQATAYQQLHERHENSINAILTFLATFYNRSLDKNKPDLSNLFPAFAGKQAPQQGSVVDVGEGDLSDFKTNMQSQFQRRKPLALLPAPELDTSNIGTANTVPSSTRSSTARSSVPPSRPQNPTVRPVSRGNLNTPSQTTQNIPSPIIKTDAPTPNINSIPDADEFMSAINAAGNTAQSYDSPNNLDFTSALSHLQSANNQNPLTPQERNDMLAMMTSDATNSGMPLPTAANNALTSPSPSFPPLDDIQSARTQIDMLEKLQEEQARRVTGLADRLQPLSPNGTIPGLADDGYYSNQPIGNPGEWDINNYINSDDYFPNTDPQAGDITNNANGELFGDDSLDFGGFMPSNDGNGENANATTAGAGTTGEGNGLLGDGYGDLGRVESVSSSAASPATVAGEDGDVERSASKRRRMG